MPETYTVVPVVPNCDFCTLESKTTTAFADARVPRFGGWASVCRGHFDQHDCKLGEGQGQRYVLPNTMATASVTMVIAGEDTPGALRRIDAWNHNEALPCLGFCEFPSVTRHGAQPLIKFNLRLAVGDGTTYWAVSKLNGELTRWYGEDHDCGPWPRLLYFTIHKIEEPDGRISLDVERGGSLSTWLLNHGEMPA